MEKKKVAKSVAMIMTMTVVSMVSRRVGQTTLAVSARTCWMNCRGFVRAMGRSLAGRTAAPRPPAGALQDGFQSAAGMTLIIQGMPKRSTREP